MNHVITKWQPFEGCDRLPGIVMECTDPGAILYDLSRPWVAEDGMIYATDSRIIVRMPASGYEEMVKSWRDQDIANAGVRGNPKRIRKPSETFVYGLNRCVAEAILPVVSNPCSDPPPCPKNGVECDCPACCHAFLMDEPEGGIPVGILGHKMALRYIYLLQYFGIREVRLPLDRSKEPFRFALGAIEGAVMGMVDREHRQPPTY